MDGMQDGDTIDWRTLWAETERRVGDRVIARWICETASGADGQEFLECLDDPATQRMVAHLDSMVARHLDGEPLQYVLGHWAFRHLEVMVDPRVLIPRPETELLVDHAIAALARHDRPAAGGRPRHRQRRDRALARDGALARRDGGVAHRRVDRRARRRSGQHRRPRSSGLGRAHRRGVVVRGAPVGARGQPAPRRQQPAVHRRR